MAEALLATTSRENLVREETSPHGVKLVFQARIPTPRGSARIRTVWLLPAGGTAARLVTALPA